MRKWNKRLQDGLMSEQAYNDWYRRWMLDWMANDFKAFKAFLNGRMIETMLGDLSIDDRAKLRDLAIGHTKSSIIEKDADIQRPARMSGELFDLP